MGAESIIETWLSRFKHRQDAGVTNAQEAQPNRATAIGGFGEALVAGTLRDMAWPVLRDVVLFERGRSTEIDVIARAPGAVVVLEVKTWSGFIRGEVQDVSWVRHRRGIVDVTVSNAVMQNRNHVAAVERAIRDRSVSVWGLVVSAGHARFAPSLHAHVVPHAELAAVLQEHACEGRGRAQSLDCAWSALSREASQSPMRQAGHVTRVRATLAKAKD